MQKSTRYLGWSVLRALATANAHSPLTRTGVGAVAAFASGLPTSELAREHALLFGTSAVSAISSGTHKTKAGKLGLALTVGSAAALLKLHRESLDAGTLVERALTDQLGDDYADDLRLPFKTPRTNTVPLLPTPAGRKRFVEDGHISYSDFGRRTSLDVWRRPDLAPDAMAPVLIQVHGGAWATGDKEGQAYPLMSYLAERGWVCVSVTYRLSPKSRWPDHIVDVKRAIAWVRDNIGEHGGDPSWLAITGGSAGGHLSSLAALTPNDPQFQPGFEDSDTSIDCAVPFYGVYDWTNRDGSGTQDTIDFLAERVVQQPFEDARAVFEQASPMTHVSSDAVPMMIVHGTNDTLVPVTQARAMVDLLRAESSNPVVYLELPKTQHAFDVFGSRRTGDVVAGVERFLNVSRARARSTAQVSSTT